MPLQNPGDLLLFTGTDSTNRAVGHIGIITSYEKRRISFYSFHIRKSKGRYYHATEYYAFRFVKAIRIFPQNEG